MPQLKQYRIKNPDSGESFVVSMDHPPKEEEIDNIVNLRQKGKEQQASSLAQADRTESQGLFNVDALKKAGKDVAHSIVNPTNIGLTGLTIAAPEIGIPVATGLSGINTLRQAYETYKHPDDANKISLAGSALTTGLGVAGMRNTGTVPSFSDIVSNLKNRISPKPIDAQFVDQPQAAPQSSGPATDVPYRVIPPKQLGAAPPQTPPTQIEQGSQAQIPAESSIKVNPPKAIGAGNGPPIRGQGFTVRAPKAQPPTGGVIETSKVPVSNRSSELTYGSREGAPLQEKPTGFKTNPNASQDSGTPIEANQPTSNTEKVSNALTKIETPTKKVAAPTPKTQPKVVQKTQKVQETPSKVQEQPKEITNKWLRETDPKVLEAMQPGASGTLADEINHVIQEKKSGVKTTQTPTQEDNPKFDEKAFNDYSQLLNDLPSHGGKVGHIVLRDIANQGKLAGLDQETIANDLIENLHPETTNSSGKAWNATDKIFNPDKF